MDKPVLGEVSPASCASISALATCNILSYSLTRPCLQPLPTSKAERDRATGLPKMILRYNDGCVGSSHVRQRGVSQTEDDPPLSFRHRAALTYLSFYLMTLCCRDANPPLPPLAPTSEGSSDSRIATCARRLSLPNHIRHWSQTIRLKTPQV